MTLSVERINEGSPYKVSVLHNDILEFTADNAVTYRIGFVEDQSLGLSGIYQFFILNESGRPSGNDFKIRLTVQAVFEEFFKIPEVAALYICDSSDSRQSVRSRMFSIWYNSSEVKKRYDLLDETLKSDGIEYFAALLISRDNTRYDEVTICFKAFVEDLRSKLA